MTPRVEAHLTLAYGYRKLALACPGPEAEKYRWRARVHKARAEKLVGRKHLGYFLPENRTLDGVT